MNEMRDRRELSQSAIANRLGNVEEGDKILFNDRKEPLRVTDTEATGSGLGEDVVGIKATESRDGKYVLSKDGDWYRNLGGLYRRSLRWVEVVEE